jgi:hypothetical protein
MITIIRAWVYSVLTCIGVVAAFALLMQALTGRWQHAWHNVTDVTAAFSVVFACVGALVFVPAFVVLRRLPRIASDRRLMACLGALTAPTAFIAFRLTFVESADPHTTWGWIQHWGRHPSELAAGSLPFLIPGAIFGLSASTRTRRSSRAA